MPLSDEELRLLEQMERALAEEDPRFVSALEGRNLARAARWWMAFSVVVFLAGGSAIGVGLWQQLIWVSVAGFVVMVVAASFGILQWRSHRQVARFGDPVPVDADGHQGLRLIQGGRADYPRGSTSRYQAWLDRLESRWLRRRDDYRF